MVAQTRFYGAGMRLDVQGTNWGPRLWHRASTTVQQFGREQDDDEGRGTGGGNSNPPSFFSQTVDPVASEQYQNRERWGKIPLSVFSSYIAQTLQSGSPGKPTLSRFSSPWQCSPLIVCLNTVEINEFCWVEIAYGWALIQTQEYRLCWIWVSEHSLFGIVG